MQIKQFAHNDFLRSVSRFRRIKLTNHSRDYALRDVVMAIEPHPIGFVRASFNDKVFVRF